MKFAIFIIATSLSVFATIEDHKEENTVKNDFDFLCPLVNINFSQDDIIECIEGQFYDWQSCGKYCLTISDCQYWSFDIYNTRCCLKSSFVNKYQEYDVISGVRGCS